MKFKSRKVRAQKQNKDGTISITIPKPFVDQLGYKPGDLFIFVLDTDNPEYLTMYKED